MNCCLYCAQCTKGEFKRKDHLYRCIRACHSVIIIAFIEQHPWHRYIIPHAPGHGTRICVLATVRSPRVGGRGTRMLAMVRTPRVGDRGRGTHSCPYLPKVSGPFSRSMDETLSGYPYLPCPIQGLCSRLVYKIACPSTLSKPLLPPPTLTCPRYSGFGDLQIKPLDESLNPQSLYESLARPLSVPRAIQPND